MNGVPFHRALRGIIKCPQIQREAHALLICMLDAADDTAECWLSQQQIRERTGYAIRTIRWWIGKLVGLGFLIPVYPGGRSRDGQKRWASRFRINLEMLIFHDPQPAMDCRSGDENGARNRQDSVAQPAMDGNATGNGTSRNRQRVAPNRLKTDLDRLKTEEERCLTPQVELPTVLDTEQFRATWDEWTRYRAETRKKLTPMTIKRQLKTLEGFGHDSAITSIQTSITNGWTGLFPPRPETGNGQCRTISASSKAEVRRAKSREREYGEDDSPIPTVDCSVR